ncbi:hypothetical protein JCM15548_11151 [Geofilum rubicundum JCM 15548]|uniref:Uncharacterized protein n=1 Tax=Geofilum rubicundum JCM 15548 TaxID=1236989 RepID=A0A0E9LUN2_9BACT|nr:hypothetical protein JCM15548_11151 [Geofilum rubicundum JCM 15548]
MYYFQKKQTNITEISGSVIPKYHFINKMQTSPCYFSTFRMTAKEHEVIKSFSHSQHPL